jgi:hypothetical protein
MGKEGKQRAELYSAFLQNTDLEEHTLYYHVLGDIQGKLDTSTNLRNYLAQALCEFRGIAKETINREIEAVFSTKIAMNGVVIKAYDDCKTEAMLNLLQKLPNLASVPTEPAPSPAK